MTLAPSLPLGLLAALALTAREGRDLSDPMVLEVLCQH